MATLADRLSAGRKRLVRGPGGVLTEQTEEEVQTLAQKAGLPAPPTTPMGAEMIGAGPHSSKMAGTPQQKRSALTMAQRPQESLQDALRRGQVRTQATAAEQQTMQKSEQLQALGGLGDRVHGLIQAEKKKLETADAKLQAKDTLKGAGDVDIKATADLKKKLKDLSAKPQDMQLQMEVAQALGYDANTQLSPAQIGELYQDASASIAASGAEAIDDNITADDLLAGGGLGYTKEQLAQLLGVLPDSLGSMTVRQIRDQIQNLITQEFSGTQQLTQQAQSTQLGAAERALARQGAREASAVGMRSTEADMANLRNQIERAEMVNIGGKSMPIEEALSDQTISDMISDYLSAGPGSPYRQQLQETEPELVAFIDKNKNLFTDATAALVKGATEFQTLQETNKKALTLDGAIGPELASKLKLPTGLSATAINIADYPILQAGQGLDKAGQATYSQSLATIVNTIPNAMDEFSGMTAEDIKKLGLDRIDGPWKSWYDTQVTLRNSKQELDAAQNDPDRLMEDLFEPGYSSYKAMQHEFDNQYKAKLMGLPNSFDKLSYLDPDGDGKMNSIDYFAQDKKNRLSEGYSLKDLVAGSQPPNTAKLAPPPDLSTGWEASDKVLWKSLSKFMDDGKISSKELASSNLNFDELMSLDYNSPALSGLSDRWNVIADKYAEEIIGRYDTKSERGILDYYKKLESMRDKLISNSPSGAASRIIEAFAPELTSLSRKIESYKTGRKEAEATAKKADTSNRQAASEKEARKENTNRMIGYKLPKGWDSMSYSEQRKYMKSVGAI